MYPKYATNVTKLHSYLLYLQIWSSSPEQLLGLSPHKSANFEIGVLRNHHSKIYENTIAVPLYMYTYFSKNGLLLNWYSLP